MVTRYFEIFGADGHRQKESFNDSYVWDFSENGKTRIIEVFNYDATLQNVCSVLKITRDTGEECDAELNGQLCDGIFENCRTGEVREVTKEFEAARKALEAVGVYGEDAELIHYFYNIEIMSTIEGRNGNIYAWCVWDEEKQSAVDIETLEELDEEKIEEYLM